MQSSSEPELYSTRSNLYLLCEMPQLACGIFTM